MICLSIPKRLIVALLTSLGFLLLTLIQTNFAITNALILHPDESEDLPSDVNLDSFVQLRRVHWSSLELGYLNSIFYLGYLFAHLPSGFLVHRYSATKIFVFPLLILFFLNLLMPLAINIRIDWVFGHLNSFLTGLLRLIQGLCAGCAFPSSHGILSHWCPPSERGRMGACIYSGLYAGPVFGFFLGGLVTRYFGHYSIYYLSGVLGLIWSLVFVVLISENPSEHPDISEEELFFIERGLSAVQGLSFQSDKQLEERIPWKSIMFSLPVWAICWAHFARGWTFYLLLTNQPSFLRAFGFGVTESGTFGSFPHILKVVVALSSGFIADFMRLNLRWSTTSVRKLMTCTGYLTEGTCLLLMCYVSNAYLGLFFLTIGVGTSGLMVSGWHLNHQDLSPRYASVLAGFTAVIGTTAGILSPIVAGLLTEEQTLVGWRDVFIIASGVLYACSLFYLIFASGELQIWSNGEQREEKIRLNSDKLPPLLHSLQSNRQYSSTGQTILH